MPTAVPLHYTQVSGIIEVLVYQETKRLSRMAPDRPDLEQEVRLACVKACELYDPNRIGPSPYQFLKTCVRNHLYNLNRGKYVPNNPPCSRCPLWDKANKVCIIKEEGCEKIKMYREHMAMKAALHKPDNIGYEALDSRAGHSTDNAFELDASIRDVLTPELIPYYEQMLSGHSSDIPPKIKTQIRKIVRNLLKED